MTRFIFAICFTVTAVSTMSLAPANAHMGASGIVKERMDLMVSLGKTMKALNAMARGKVDYDGRAVTRAAERLLDKSKKMQILFPEGSINPPSMAKPEIRTRMDDFRAFADALGGEAKKLAAIGENGDAKTLAQQFRRVGKTCSACHKPFRTKKRDK